MQMRLLVLGALLAAGAGLGAQQRPAAPPAGGGQSNLAELWAEPEPDRDLFYGVGGASLAPRPQDLFSVLEIKIHGFSEGYTVEDPAEHEWSVKFPPEALTEMVVSRLHWGVGYHQPPQYLLREWKADGATAPNPQLPARFRQKSPDFHGLKAGDNWSFKDNPFIGTRPLAGLLVLQAIVENPDIKTSNNTVYTLTSPVEGAQKWYVVRDLGYSLGRSGFNSPRADVDAFERAPFIRGVVNGHVDFYYGGRNKGMIKNITVEDVRWICQRLARLTDKQWTDAFRAGAYEPSEAQRFIRKLKARIAEGLALR